MDITDIAMDRARCDDGARFPFGDATLIVASVYSRRYQIAKAAVERAIRIRAADKQPDFTEAELYDMDIGLVAETLLLGWENVTENGQSLDPTIDNRRHVLRSAPPLLVTVRNLAQQFAPYTLLADEAAQKNFERSSPGNAGGDRTPSDGLPNSQQEAA
jgi:hypothetical protein